VKSGTKFPLRRRPNKKVSVEQWSHLRRIKLADLTTTPILPEELDSIIQALYWTISDTTNKCMSFTSLVGSVRDVCVKLRALTSQPTNALDFPPVVRRCRSDTLSLDTTMKIILFPLFLALVAMHASMATPQLRVSKAAEDLALDMSSSSSSSWPEEALDADWSDMKWSASTFPAAVSKLPFHHRAMLSVASRLCFAGLPAGCVCTEDAVRSAIADATSGKLLRPRIRICSGVCKHIYIRALAGASRLYSSHLVSLRGCRH
jgi:hypothetical protein